VNESHPVFFSEKLKKFYESLRKKQKQRILLDDMIQVLSKNLFAGNRIQRKRIPQHYKTKYQVDSLFRYRHPEGYRSTYTIVIKGQNEQYVLVLDIMNHKKYENRFGYT
jgi:mRNA-degrading endonuclease RelE of RelBE toxin-antitoxin system